MVEVPLAGVRDAFRKRTRSARRSLQCIHRAARRKGEAAAAAQRAAYGRLCQVARQVVRQAERVQQVLADGLAAGATRGGLATRQVAERVGNDLTRLLPLVRQVMAQAERRVLQGEVVPADEKLVSLHEPHTAIITRHKPGRPVEFGRKLWLAEADGGIITVITDAQVLAGAPPDAPQVADSLMRHRRQFARAPDLLTGDRGCSTPESRRAAAAAGVRRVALPHTGRPTPTSRARERRPCFRRGYRWRAGIEGRIGHLQRAYGLDRCPDHGAEGLERWVGWGVLIHDLVTIARATATR